MIPVCWTSGDVSLEFRHQSGQPYSCLVEAYVSGATPADLLTYMRQTGGSIPTRGNILSLDFLVFT